MSQPTESPGAAVPGNAPAPPAPASPSSSSTSLSTSAAAPDVSRQIAELTDAVNRLVQAEQKRSTNAPAPQAAPLDIGGEIPGGATLVPAVDYAKLSPVQQIALGLRDAKPVGPAHSIVARAPRNGAPVDLRADETSPSGAD